MTKEAAAKRWSKRVDRLHAEYQQRLAQLRASDPKPEDDRQPVSMWR